MKGQLSQNQSMYGREWGEVERGEARLVGVGDGEFHVISDEEIQRSLTISAEYKRAAEPEPKYV